MSETQQPLVDKYRPQTTEDVQGNTSDLRQLEAWLRDFQPGDEPHLLYGPPGVGKTSAAEVLANDFDLPITEINASDSRRTDAVKEFVREARSTPFTGGYKLIVLDEVDSMSGQSNLQPLYDLLDDPPNPIILICNEKYEVPNGITRRVEDHKFSLGIRSRRAKIKEVVKAEDIDCGADTVAMLAERENLRDALQDLDAYIKNPESMSSEDGREYEGNIFEEMDAVIKGNDVSLSETPERSVNWIDKNIRDRYRLVEAAAAWDALSRSDCLNARVWHGSGDPNYRWWRYSGAILDMIPELRLSEAYDGYISKSSPDYYGYGGVSDAVESAYQKFAKGPSDAFEMGASVLFFKRKILPMLQVLDHDERSELAMHYGLEGNELEVLNLSESEFDDWRESDQSSSTEMEQSSFMDW